MAIIITTDNVILPDRDFTNVVITAHGDLFTIARLRAGAGVPFRAVDANGDVYYEGRWLDTRLADDNDDKSIDGDLAPVALFAAEGVTNVLYYNALGEWKAQI